MPTPREREYYRMGFTDGFHGRTPDTRMLPSELSTAQEVRDIRSRKPKRKLSAWNKYIKNKRNHIKYRDGKLNLKKMAVAFRRKKRR
jgi:hypothetical protein